jgi:hypothetical protein
MTNKKEQLRQLQTMIVIKFVCLIALYFSFLLGPALAVFRLYFFLQQPKVEWETSPALINTIALAGFVVLIWIKRVIDQKIEAIRSNIGE